MAPGPGRCRTGVRGGPASRFSSRRRSRTTGSGGAPMPPVAQAARCRRDAVSSADLAGPSPLMATNGITAVPGPAPGVRARSGPVPARCPAAATARRPATRSWWRTRPSPGTGTSSAPRGQRAPRSRRRLQNPPMSTSPSCGGTRPKPHGPRSQPGGPAAGHCVRTGTTSPLDAVHLHRTMTHRNVRRTRVTAGKPSQSGRFSCQETTEDRYAGQAARTFTTEEATPGDYPRGGQPPPPGGPGLAGLLAGLAGSSSPKSALAAQRPGNPLTLCYDRSASSS